MGYTTLRQCVDDLERNGMLRRIDAEVDAHLELASIQRRAFRAGAPALLFTRVRGSSFPMLCNLFGTRERLHFIFGTRSGRWRACLRPGRTRRTRCGIRCDRWACCPR